MSVAVLEDRRSPPTAIVQGNFERHSDPGETGNTIENADGIEPSAELNGETVRRNRSLVDRKRE
ncbi:hypothetical protein EA472_17050 [Natrarchaeobius oligotrophus]|uniref:Uncharacterized protein n=1 Tax=Natrarchaeobius chitinivorans TaxID=1679083 RepID=A0A3N6MUZ3_NATCH|nr:hypothetical protein EA472_17050 [Natrarchaeobius chitinivorans]